MEPLVVSEELEFRQEATKRTLLQLFEAQDFEGLLGTAMMLNTLWHQQTVIAQWFAHEAAENLGEAWQAHRAK